MRDFISEDDLDTFEGWLKYQAVDVTIISPGELAIWRDLYDEVKKASVLTPKVGRMKLPPGEHRYAVALRNSEDLWLTLWVRRSPKGDVYVFLPRADRRWNPHASYHRDGTVHSKSFDHKFFPRKRKPLTGAFKGTEHLGTLPGTVAKGSEQFATQTIFPVWLRLRLGLWADTRECRC